MIVVQLNNVIISSWNIYFSLVYSHLSYGIHAWGSANKTTLNKLEVVQNKAIHILSGVQYFQIYGQDPGPLPSSEPLFKKLKILVLEDIFKLNLANFVYSTLDFESPQIFHDWLIFNHEICNHNTRLNATINQEQYFDNGTVEPSLSLRTRGSNNSYGQKMIKASGPILWNSIPEIIQKSTSVSSFKTQLKKYFLGGSIENTSNNNYNNNYTYNNNNNQNRQNMQFQSRWNPGSNNLV